MNEAVWIVCKAEDVWGDAEYQISVLVNAELRPVRSLKPKLQTSLSLCLSLTLSVCLSASYTLTHTHTRARARAL